MVTRRELLQAVPALGVAVGLGSKGCTWQAQKDTPVAVNDIHSQLNLTRVNRIVQPQSIEGLQTVVHSARTEGHAVSIAGGMHAMGGQQFGTGTILLDTRNLNRVLNFDPDRGIIEVEAGIQWPELINYLIAKQ